MRAGTVVGTILFGFVMHGVAAPVPQQSPPAQPEAELRRVSLSSGGSLEVSPEWIEREQVPLPPSPRLAPFAPPVTFLEFTALENPKMHSVLRIATTTNPFVGGDEVALDVQMHSGAGSGSALADYLFYFFFSP